MNNTLALSSLAMDLKRVALGIHRGSLTMAERFTQEAMKRKQGTDTTTLKPYMQSIIEKLEDTLSSSDLGKKAEDSLMYSTLIQNYVLKEQVPLSE